ncbi:hypothetical protein ACGF12_35880 [Kitasatospora sp. NPDC048296]|uniref:hypothetical protein n=1 Tax=Kitasatospora sp. NPDC048296 TaxID=3364048 RepID=UPI00370FC130
MENTTMFRAVFALGTDGEAQLSVLDTAGKLLASHTKHNVKTPSGLRSNLWWARTTLAAEYVLAEDAHWQRGESGLTWTAPLVLRRPHRYRVDMSCGHSIWTDFPPLASRYSCTSCKDRQLITQYLDSAVGTIRVIMAG